LPQDKELVPGYEKGFIKSARLFELKLTGGW
jgi:hypothetical protein